MFTAKDIHYQFTTDPDEVDQWVHKGYYLVNDKPSESGYVSAATAYRNFLGIRRENPRFVIVGTEITPHLCFCIACLSGLIPRASERAEDDPGKLAKVITAHHEDPRKFKYPDTREENLLLLWWHKWDELNNTSESESSELRFGVELWYTLTHSDEYRLMREVTVARKKFDKETRIMSAHFEDEALQRALEDAWQPGETKKLLN